MQQRHTSQRLGGIDPRRMAFQGLRLCAERADLTTQARRQRHGARVGSAVNQGARERHAHAPCVEVGSQSPVVAVERQALAARNAPEVKSAGFPFVRVRSTHMQQLVRG